MQITYLGPEGAKFVGKTFTGVNLAEAATDDIADLQRATGWKMGDLQRVAEDADILGYQMLQFFTLRAGGHKVSWDVAKSVRLVDIDVVAEPGDLDDEGGDDDVDPQVAVTVSPVAAANVPPTKSSKSR